MGEDEPFGRGGRTAVRKDQTRAHAEVSGPVPAPFPSARGGPTTGPGAYILSGRLDLTPSVRLAAELPISHYDSDRRTFGRTGTGLGGPYLGVELGARGQPWLGELGLRIPTDGDYLPLRSGFASDLTRWEAFSRDLFSLRGRANYWLDAASVAPNLRVRLQGGASLWVYVEQGESSDLIGDYSAQLWYDGAPLKGGVGILGRANLTDELTREDERTAHQLALSVLGTYRGIQPGLHVGVPVESDDFAGVVDFVVGISLTADLS